jgi:hypothetical protein
VEVCKRVGVYANLLACRGMEGRESMESVEEFMVVRVSRDESKESAQLCRRSWQRVGEDV